MDIFKKERSSAELLSFFHKGEEHCQEQEGETKDDVHDLIFLWLLMTTNKGKLQATLWPGKTMNRSIRGCIIMAAGMVVFWPVELKRPFHFGRDYGVSGRGIPVRVCCKGLLVLVSGYR